MKKYYFARVTTLKGSDAVTSVDHARFLVSIGVLRFDAKVPQSESVEYLYSLRRGHKLSEVGGY
jgi:hypothetical protein